MTDDRNKFFPRILLVVALFGNGFCLKNVQLRSAEAIRAGENLHLSCDYDLENALLYSIKWYLADEEFYRYVPKESPPTRVFALPGIFVDISRSNDKDVTLTDVQRHLTGYYKCEVSADAPSFHTDIKSALVVVTEEPRSPPILTTEKTKYSIGEYVRANCSSYCGYPAAQIIWFLNEVQQNDSFLGKTWATIEKEADGLETSHSKLEIYVTSGFFEKGKARLKCRVSQFDLYAKSVEVQLEDDTPQLAHVLSPSTTTRENFSFRSPPNDLALFTSFLLAAYILR